MGDSPSQPPELLGSAQSRRRKSPTEELSAGEAAGSTHATASSSGAVIASPSLLRRNSSDESHETGWFERSNRNPTATFDASSMDVDPPFFQKANASHRGVRQTVHGSPADVSLGSSAKRPQLRPTATQSSSADDFRSVIDDLTIENKRLKEELKRYKQFGSDLMRNDKLFEIKVHGLPSRKKRELEATLRNFAASLGSSTEASSRQKPSRSGASGTRGKSYVGSMSKHASSSSSRSRPVDSAYASMSTGSKKPSIGFAGATFSHPSLASRARSANQKVESYLQDIPEGWYPGRSATLTEKEKKKLVVKRLEQLFTGEIKAPSLTASGSVQQAERDRGEPGREAHMQVLDNKTPSRANQSSDSHGDGTSGGGDGSGVRSGSGKGSHASRQSPSAAAEQRPTRPRDLDPDRIQVPSENVDYIRHLGMVPPELLPGAKTNPYNVSMDAKGWVYLNLLCNLAQLHMFNVTPAFIRDAVSSKSAKFQLSPDGRKIRWRGGTDGTKFSSDSGNTSSRERSNDEVEDGDDGGGGEVGSSDKRSGEQGTKRKLVEDDNRAPSSKNKSRLGPQATRSSATSVQYKPLFIRQSSSFETSLEQSSSRASGMEDSNLGNTSKWDYSGSGSSPNKNKRRRTDGAIVYYTSAPFCTDLSGDPGDISPAAYMASANNEAHQLLEEEDGDTNLREGLFRTSSGSSLPFRPLSDRTAFARLQAELNQESTYKDPEDGMSSGDEDMSDSEYEFPWSDPAGMRDSKQSPAMVLEACGLGSIIPDDHFAVVVITRHPRDVEVVNPQDKAKRPQLFGNRSVSTASSIMRRHRLGSTPGNTISLPPRAEGKTASRVNIEYVSARTRRLKPVPLPPAAMFFPPFSSSSSDSEDCSDSEMLESDEQDAAMSRSLFPTEMPASSFIMGSPGRAYLEGEEGLATDEEDEVESDDPAHDIAQKNLLVLPTGGGGGGSSRPRMGRGLQQQQQQEQQMAMHSTARHRSRQGVLAKAAEQPRAQSSAATAGGAESGYNSSIEAA